jgi:hypothetical protein
MTDNMTDINGVTAGQLADILGVNRHAMEKRVRRTFPDISPALSCPLSAEQVRVLSVGKAARKQGTRAETAQKTPIERPAVKYDTKASAPAAGNFLRTDTFLVCAMIVGMVSQMVHTAGFFFNNSPISETELKIVLSVIFAVGVDSTALIMTIHRGGTAYLWTFAVIHFLMNITFHTQVHAFGWDFQSFVGIFGYILLSFVIAFSNFSYTELFSRKK